MAKRNFGEHIKLMSYDDMLGNSSGPLDQNAVGQIVEVPLTELYEFENHPFKVVNDEKMEETVESVRSYGVLVPGIVRPRKEGGYEIISGHRRRKASELAGKDTMPVIVRDCSDDEATIIMVDSNIQRDDISISEKAKAYRMKYEAMKHQGSAGGLSLDEMSEQTGDSAKTIQRLINISRLNEELLALVDSKKLGIRQGYALSFLGEDKQEMVSKIMKEVGSVVKAEQIKEADKKEYLNEAYVKDLLTFVRPRVRKVVLDHKKLDSYFEPDMTNNDIEELIVKLLNEWKKKGGR